MDKLTDALKGFDFSPWGGLEGFLAASKSGQTSNNVGASLKKVVPDLSRAVDMTANAVASLPFEFVNDNGDVVDSSVDWQDEIGGMPNPQRLLYLLASSLCGGAAYLIPQRTPRFIYDLQYAVPHSITPYIDINGLQYFDRATDQGKVARYKPKEIIYFWLPDSDVEIGPALNTPLSNATQDALLSLNSKNTMRIYGERGFVPITLLGAKGMPNDGERQKAEGFFDRLLRGGFDVLAKIVNSDALSLIKVGAGMEELKGSYIEILRQSKEDIAQAFGIPTALFMSDNAFASEFNALVKLWYTSSRFVSIYHTIEEVFTAQLLKPYKLAMFFRPETLDAFQEDETARSTSLGSVVSAIDTNPQIAKFTMGILGYDLTEEQKKELDEIIAVKEEEKEKLDEQMTDGKVDENGEPVQEATQEPKKKPVTLSPDETKDLSLWYSKAKTWFLKGKGSAVDWENKHLSEEIAAPIRQKLADAKTELDIVKAFELGELEDKSDLLILADAINKAVEKG